ncbi:MAG: ribonuclease H-like domain-containing protein [Anaerolineae bacterium]
MPTRDLGWRDDLRRRLLRLGMVRGERALSSPSSRPRVAIENIVDGSFHETPHGRCFVASGSFPADHLHGDLALGNFLNLSSDAVATVGDEAGLAEADLRQSLFLDTETTGLSGGTGTMAFVVGMGFFEKDRFRLLQTFLRDPGDEPAMIHLLAELLPRFEALVSFNGRGFDLPILETRFILARRRFPLVETPHMDLLPPSRRLWRSLLPSCALGTLEREVLGVVRDQADVPGGVIPYIYRDYLRTGDAREISRVLYHNQVDILSMVTLAARLVQTFASPWSRQELTGAELYCLARWYRQSGGEQERALLEALGGDLSHDLRLRALRDLALFLKRQDRRAEAIGWWQQLAIEDPAGIRAPVELAKTFEWHIRRLMLASAWTQLALERAEEWPAGQRRERALARLRHRLERLRGKLEE